MKRNISRKEFLIKGMAGAAGLSISAAGQDLSGMALPLRLRSVGKTGLMVSPVCFGAPRTNDESLIRYAVDKGINFIDTGRSYGNGNNEKLVGRAVRGMRDKVVIQSKIRLEKEEVPSGTRGKRGGEEIVKALSSKVKESLEALATDYIDILLIHDASDEALLFHPSTTGYFSDLKKSGVIRAHGFSTHTDCMNLLERNNSDGFFDVVMIPFNHNGAFTHSLTGRKEAWDQERLVKMLEESSAGGKGVISMKTCSGGPYPENGSGKPGYHYAVKWVISHPFISSAAVAMASFAQVDEHLSVVDD